MDTVNCPQCRQVNFANLTHCKRCQTPLQPQQQQNESSGFAADQNKAFQPAPQSPPTAFAPAAPPNNIYGQNNYQPFQTPPPPPVFHGQEQSSGYNQNFYQQQQQFPPQNCCIKCGSRDRSVAIQNFKKTYLPPIAYIGIIIGPLVFLILALVLRVRHYLSAPFCSECWGSFKNQPLVTGLLNFATVVVILGGFIFSFLTENFTFAGLGVVFCIGIAIGTKVYESSVSPKFKKIDGKMVVIDAPTVGDVTFYR
jgi:hypothetical protein